MVSNPLHDLINALLQAGTMERRVYLFSDRAGSWHWILLLNSRLLLFDFYSLIVISWFDVRDVYMYLSWLQPDRQIHVYDHIHFTNR
jgi:hypothetical protein